MSAREEDNFEQLVNLLRSGLVRNLGNITAPKLYNRTFSGTKYLIEEYISQVAESVSEISSLPTVNGDGSASTGDDDGVATAMAITRGSAGAGSSASTSTTTALDGGRGGDSVLTNQMKLDFIHDTRQAFGRSTLVLQGGAIFGLCHLGVVRALFLRGLLPRIITGTATGALIAALVAIHTVDELPAILTGEGINLSAFGPRDDGHGGDGTSRWETLLRRLRRFSREGYFLDVTVLEECVRDNVGELTFEEAYNRSKRVLNITVATRSQGGVPTLLNYLTAPNVVSSFGSLLRSFCPFVTLLHPIADRNSSSGPRLWHPTHHRPPCTRKRRRPRSFART